LQLCSTIYLKFVWTCHKGHNHYAMSHSLYNVFLPFFNHFISFQLTFKT
jgi:hypothetical protein